MGRLFSIVFANLCFSSLFSLLQTASTRRSSPLVLKVPRKLCRLFKIAKIVFLPVVVVAQCSAIMALSSKMFLSLVLFVTLTCSCLMDAVNADAALGK